MLYAAIICEDKKETDHLAENLRYTIHTSHMYSPLYSTKFLQDGMAIDTYKVSDPDLRRKIWNKVYNLIIICSSDKKSCTEVQRELSHDFNSPSSLYFMIFNEGEEAWLPLGVFVGFSRKPIFNYDFINYFQKVILKVLSFYNVYIRSELIRIDPTRKEFFDIPIM